MSAIKISNDIASDTDKASHTSKTSHTSVITTRDFGQALFSSRVSGFIAVLSGCLVILSVGIALYGYRPFDSSATPTHSYASGPIGHRAFVSFLQRIKIHSVRIHQVETLKQASQPLFLIEPLTDLKIHGVSISEVKSARIKAGFVSILILPKWFRRPDPFEPGFEQIPLHRLQHWLKQALPKLQTNKNFLGEAPTHSTVSKSNPTITIHQMPVADTSAALVADWVESSASTAGSKVRFALSTQGVQVMYVKNSPFEPLLNSEHGAIIARYTSSDGGVLYLVSDPDLLHNFNLQRGENAALWLALIRNSLRTDTILIDEVFHNLVKQFSLAEELGSFPQVFFVIQALLLCAFFVWAGMRRFGRPVISALTRRYGPREIIEITAWLQVCSQKSARLGQMYVQAIFDDLGERLGLGDISIDEKLGHIDNIAQKAQIKPIARELQAKAQIMSQRRRDSALEALRIADRAWTFRKQILERR
jgi:hypothetical protein